VQFFARIFDLHAVGVGNARINAPPPFCRTRTAAALSVDLSELSLDPRKKKPRFAPVRMVVDELRNDSAASN
jgi:hypothetical protein